MRSERSKVTRFPTELPLPSWQGQIVLIAILLLGALLRLYHLQTVPPGFTHDETAHLQDAQRIWEGARPLYLTSGYGREPLFDYATAPLVGLLGMKAYTGRLSSVTWGLLLVAATYTALRGPLGKLNALAATLLLAVSFWPLSTSRQVLRSVTMPVLFATAVALFWRGLYRPGHNLGHFVGAGTLLGLGFYTYMPARAMWAVPVLFWLSLAAFERCRFAAHARGVLLMLAVAAFVAGPLIAHLASHPELEVRVAELAWPLRAALSGQPRPLLERVAETALMFSGRGDTHWMYNLSGRPLLPLPLTLLFYAGLALALARLRQPGPRLMLLWLLIGIAPALLTGLESCSLRAIGTQPAVFGLCALPLAELQRQTKRRVSRPALQRLPLVLTLLIAGSTTAGTFHSYFVQWANHPDVRVAYHVHLAAEADYLDQQQPQEPLVLSTFYPAQPHDPATLAVLRGKPGPALRWCDGRGALVLPDTDVARLLLPGGLPLDPALEALVHPYARPLPPISLRPTDLVTRVTVLEWDIRQARAALPDQVPVAIHQGDALPPDHAYQPLSLPVQLGQRLSLLGYQLLTPTLQPEQELVLVTFWQVRQPGDGSELVLFAHLMDDQSHIVGQSDRLDAPAWNWHAGDVLAQVHRISIPAGTPPGSYHLQTGAYRPGDAQRLQIQLSGRPVGDRILLQPVEVTSP